MRDLKQRGLCEPKLVTGDSELGLWGALSDVFPKARQQRCWVHKIANVLDAMPKRVQPRAKAMLHEIMEAETRRRRRAGARGVASRVRRQVPEGGREARQGPQRAACLLRLPRRALTPPAHKQPDRVGLRNG
jgi:putative transposase